MLESKEFFEGLKDGEEYLSLMVTKDVYFKIDPELRSKIYSGDVRQKNNSFKNDENHKILLKNRIKANNELRDYEYIINQSKK